MCARVRVCMFVCRDFPATRYFPPAILSIASSPQRVFASSKVSERDEREGASKGERDGLIDAVLACVCVCRAGRSSECDDRKLPRLAEKPHPSLVWPLLIHW